MEQTKPLSLITNTKRLIVITKEINKDLSRLMRHFQIHPAWTMPHFNISDGWIRKEHLNLY